MAPVGDAEDVERVGIEFDGVASEAWERFVEFAVDVVSGVGYWAYVVSGSVFVCVVLAGGEVGVRADVAFFAVDERGELGVAVLFCVCGVSAGGFGLFRFGCFCFRVRLGCWVGRLLRIRGRFLFFLVCRRGGCCRVT